MPRGGHRKGSGRPSTWKSGCKFADTTVIRVPINISEKLLEIAHALDSGEMPLDSVTKTNAQLSLPEIQPDNVCLSRNELIAKGQEIVYDTKVVTQRDRTSVRKALGSLLGVPYETFKK